MLKALDEMVKSQRFAVSRQGNGDIILTKMVAKRPVSVLLRAAEKRKGYWIEPPEREFTCTYSHFDYSQPEMRFVRRKTLMMHLVAQLRETNLWQFILNKGFVVVNEANSKMNKRVVRDQFNKMVQG
jgi:hypothetical protein